MEKIFVTKEDYVSIRNCSLEEITELFQDYNEYYNVRLNHHGCDVYICYDRLETDEEFNTRVSAIKDPNHVSE